MEEATIPVAMHRNIRGIEVEDQLFGWLVMEGNELLEQSFVDINAKLTVNAVLQSTLC
jgi:hypothetical protein